MASSLPCSLVLHCMLLLALVLMTPCSAEDIILRPSSSGGGREAAVILMPAPQMLPAQYLPLAKAMQASTSQRLWMCLVDLGGAVQPAPKDVAVMVGRAAQGLVAEGFKMSEPSFIAAHSEATASAMQDYAVSTLNATGLILLGSFLKRSYRASPPYPIPTLTIGGELDGVCRVTRIMEEYVHRIHAAENRTAAIKHSPVVVIRGMTHMQFASGKPSDNIQQYDLKPEIEDSKALQSVSDIAACFMEGILGNASSLSVLKDIVLETGGFLQPLIGAYVQEGSYQFKPPCNEDPPSSACQVGSNWTVGAMPLMAEIKNVVIDDKDSFHPASEIFPAIHHPKIFSHCSSPNASCTISLSSVSQNIYYEDKADTGLVPNAACEIRAKLKSRQSVMLAAGFKDVEFNISDAGSRCKTINQHAYDWALNRSSNATRERFHKFGIPIVMGDDQGCFHNGGLWIYLPMKYSLTREQDSGTVRLAVSSIQLKTDVKYPIGMFQGMHFCKLLSPAKVMEWVYVDGLRAHYSLSGNWPKLMHCGL